MYSAQDGLVEDWHLVHLGARAVGGAGLILTEMTAVAREGRITPGCAGIYLPEHVPAWRRIVDFVHRRSEARIGVQLGHAGRKGATSVPWEADKPLSEGAWPLWAPSPLPYAPGRQTPRVMDAAAMTQVREEYVRAARRAVEAGFDLLELHMAHAYTLSSFLSRRNHRRDEFGGSLENRAKVARGAVRAVRAEVGDRREFALLKYRPHSLNVERHLLSRWQPPLAARLRGAPHRLLLRRAPQPR